MGLFDTFIDTDGTEYQSKAFGRGLRTYHVGDPVRLRRAPFTAPEFDAHTADLWDANPGPGADTCQVQTGDDRYLTIEDHTFTGTTPTRNPAVDLFDYHGRNITDLHRMLDDPHFARRRTQVTALVIAHPLAIRAAYLNPQDSDRVNEAVACLLGWCRIYMCHNPTAVPEPTAHAALVAARRQARTRTRTPQARLAAQPGTRSRDTNETSDITLTTATSPESVFVLTDGSTPGPTKGCPDPTLAALIDDPVMDLEHIAVVFTDTITLIRDLPDITTLYFPNIRTLTDADADADPTRHVRPGWSGEEQYTEHVTAMRQAGLNVAGPGWADALLNRTG